MNNKRFTSKKKQQGAIGAVMLQALTLRYIRTEKPYGFSFYGTTQRKRRMYVKLTKKILKKNPDIAKKYFFMKDDTGYGFFKKNK